MSEFINIPPEYDDLFTSGTELRFLGGRRDEIQTRQSTIADIEAISNGIACGDLAVGEFVAYEHELPLIQQCIETSAEAAFRSDYEPNIAAGYQAGAEFAAEMIRQNPEQLFAWRQITGTRLYSTRVSSLMGRTGYDLEYTGSSSEPSYAAHRNQYYGHQLHELGENHQIMTDQAGFAFGFREKIKAISTQFRTQFKPVNHILPALGIYDIAEPLSAGAERNLDTFLGVVQKMTYLEAMIEKNTNGTLHAIHEADQLARSMREVLYDYRVQSTQRMPGVISPSVARATWDIPNANYFLIEEGELNEAAAASTYFDEEIALNPFDNPFYRIMNQGMFLFASWDEEDYQRRIDREDNAYVLERAQRAANDIDTFFDADSPDGYYAWWLYMTDEGYDRYLTVHNFLEEQVNRYRAQLGFGDSARGLVTATGLPEEIGDDQPQMEYEIPIDPVARVSYTLNHRNNTSFLQDHWIHMGIEDEFDQMLIVARVILNDNELRQFLRSYRNNRQIRSEMLSSRNNQLELARRYMYEYYGWTDLYNEDNSMNLEPFLHDQPFWESQLRPRAIQRHYWERVKRFAETHELFDGDELPIFHALINQLQWNPVT